MHSLLLAAALAAAAAPPTAPSEAPPADAPTGPSPYARLLLLPDVSAIGAAGLAWSSYGVDARSPRDGVFGQPRRVEPYFDELELALQAVVDPYARADVFIGFHADEVEVEEAYVTALRLPAGLLGRGGVFFTPFGRENVEHPHQSDFVDQALPHARLLAPEVLSGPGLDVAWLAPLPWFSEVRVAYQGVRPGGHAHGDEQGEEEGASRAGTLRLLQVLQVGERTTASLGVSGTLLEDAAGGFSDLAGVDLYLKRDLGATRASIALEAEAVRRRLRLSDEPRDSDWGAYAQLVLRPGARTMYGVRYERAPGVVDEGAADAAEHRVAAVLGWLPSEFQRIRLQGAWDRLPGGDHGLEALLAIEFSFGAHGAHQF